MATQPNFTKTPRTERGVLSAANPEVSNRYIINNVLGFAGGFDKLKYYDVPLVGSIDEVELKEIERDKR